MVVEVREQPGRNGGRLRRGNPGVRSVLVILQDMSRKRLRKAIELAGTIIEDKEASVEDQMRAAEFLRRCTGMDRERPTARKRSTFSVVSATPAEQAAKLAPPGSEPELAKPDPDAGAPR
jgi:hypothetical protein